MDAQIRFGIGDSFVLNGTSSDLYRVVKVSKQGVSVLVGGKPRADPISFKEIIAAFANRRFRHWPGGLEHLDERKAEMLKVAFSAWPSSYRREAHRREAYLLDVEARLPACRTLEDAYEQARNEVFAANRDDWEAEEKEAAHRDYASKGHRKGESFDGPTVKHRQIKKPATTTIAEWRKDWLSAAKDICALVPMWHLKGRRKPFYEKVDPEGRSTYDFAKNAIDSVYMTLLRASKAAAYQYYEDLIKESQLPDSEQMSDRAFRSYIDRLYNHRDQCIARKGRRKAYLEHGIFIPQKLPDRPLEEVEIDHCLVDVILRNKRGRILGRPWITVMLDRATRCVIGIHITFQPPSYHSVRLALAHSIYPKDLSAFPAIKRTWDCFGVPEYLISDQGKEFKSRSYKSTCSALGISPVVLPGRSPWLKGAIERLFGHLGVRVFDLMEGATKFNSVDAYRSAKSARLDKDEFTERLLRWIVDRYHHRPHPTLEERYGRGTTPSMAWDVLTTRYGVRLARDPEQVHLITGEVFKCKIKADGISIGSQRYLDKPILQKLRDLHGPRKVWTVHRDDTDWGYVRILDDTGPSPCWLTIPNFDGEVMSGVSKAQFKIIFQEAREMTKEGDAVSVATFARAKDRVERERTKLHDGRYKPRSSHQYLLKWARYGDLGTLVTPVPGFEHQIVANDDEPALQRALKPNGGSCHEENARGEATSAVSRPSTEWVDDLDDVIAERAKLWGVAHMIPGYEPGELEAVAASSRLEQSIIHHPALTEGLKRLRLHQARSLRLFDQSPQPSHLLIVTGHPGAGKSTLLKEHQAAFKSRDMPDGKVMPVILVEMPYPCTMKGFVECILSAMGHEPSSDMKTTRIVEEIANFTRRHGVLLIAIDEADRIFGSEAPMLAKFLVSLLNSVDCQIVLAGAPEILQLNKGWGLERRKDEDLVLTPYRFDTREGQTNFRTLLEVFDTSMGLPKPSGLRSYDLSKRIFLASGGHIGLVSKMLVEALKRAHVRQLDHLSVDLLGEVYDAFKQTKVDATPVGFEVDVDTLPEQIAAPRDQNPLLCTEKQLKLLWEAGDCSRVLVGSHVRESGRTTKARGEGKS